MDFKIKKLPIIIFSAVFLVLLLTSTFFDMQVTKILVDIPEGSYYSNNLFGVIGEVIGSFPIYYMIGLAVICLALGGAVLKPSLKNIFFIIAIVGGFIAMFIGADDCLKDFADHSVAYANWQEIFKILLASAFALAFEIPTIIIVNRFSDETKKKLMIFACVTLVMVVISQIIIYVLKFMVGRARYKAMNVLGDESLYTPWYIFNGKRVSEDPRLIELGVQSNAYKSFPSGHTASSAAVYAFLCLPYIFDKFNNKKWKTILNVSTIAFTGYIAISRIVVGAHFYSDVLFGGTITYLSVFLGVIIVKAILKKISNKQKETEKLPQ